MTAPPDVIPIDARRQLFVDDHLIEHTTLRRTFHAATVHDSPMLEPDRPWEMQGDAPAAMTFSDGVWYDPADRLFKMWYMGGLFRSTCYAVSEDGLRWTKTSLDVVPGTNIVQLAPRDSSTVWMDLDDPNPRRRFKMFRFPHDPSSYAPLQIHFSPNGIHWSDVVARTGICVDRSTVFYNPIRRKWVFSIRDMLPEPIVRARRYLECDDVTRDVPWKLDELPLWAHADDLDPPRVDTKDRPQLYNLDAAAYEAELLGMFSMMRGVRAVDGTKTNDIVLGFSRDGFHWDRPWREPFIPVSESPADWNYAYLQSAGGCYVTVGDRLHFYVGARGFAEGKRVYRTGLATLRRDGFASMDAGAAGGTLTTRPLRFSGSHLFVNADTKGGELTVELVDRDFRSHAMRGLDSTRHELIDDLTCDRARLRFHLRDARLFSFWIA